MYWKAIEQARKRSFKFLVSHGIVNVKLILSFTAVTISTEYIVQVLDYL